MNDRIRTLAVFMCFSAGVLILASCESEKKGPPDRLEAATGSEQVSNSRTTPGEAGGTAEDTFTVSVRVAAVDAATRKITLQSEDGSKASFIAGPEIKNFDQILVGDKVTATIKEKLHVFVRSDGESPNVTHAAALSTAPKGAKPGVMVGQVFEIVATVKAIDADKRTATLEFSEGQTRTIPVRKDVELSRYKVGDSVVIQVSESLSLLVEKP